MKRFFQSTILLMTLALAVACGEKEPVWVAPTHTMSVAQSDLVFEPLGGSSSFTVTAENPFTVATDRDWCTAVANGAEVSVTVTANPHNETRYARVNLTSGTETLGITVQQSGIIVKGFTPQDTIVTGSSHVLNFNYTSNSGTLSITSPQDWITIAQADGAVTITIAANGDGVRNGTVNYALGTLQGHFTVKQYPTFTVNADWAPAYAGKSIYQDIVQDIFTLTVAPASVGTPYATMLLSKADFDAKGVTMVRYIEMEGWKEALAPLNQKVAANAGTSLADYLLTDSVADTLASTAVPSGNCYLIAVGLTAEGEPTGKYAATLLSNAAASYNSWLGTWAATDDRGATYTLTIAQKVAGTSYTVSGLKGYDLPMNAVYNADGTISLTGSSTTSILSAEYAAGDYNYSTLYTLGAYSRNNTSTVLTGASYNIGFGAQRGATGAVLMGHWTKVSSNWYPFVQLLLRGNGKKGTASFSNRVLERTYLPVTLVKQ